MSESLFNKVASIDAGLKPASLLKRTPAKVFSYEFCEIFNNFFTEHLWAVASVYLQNLKLTIVVFINVCHWQLHQKYSFIINHITFIKELLVHRE